jgi:hypothetical protein
MMRRKNHRIRQAIVSQANIVLFHVDHYSETFEIRLVRKKMTRDPSNKVI